MLSTSCFGKWQVCQRLPGFDPLGWEETVEEGPPVFTLRVTIILIPSRQTDRFRNRTMSAAEPLTDPPTPHGANPQEDGFGGSQSYSLGTRFVERNASDSQYQVKLNPDGPLVVKSWKFRDDV